jgi:hypothetical protein
MSELQQRRKTTKKPEDQPAAAAAAPEPLATAGSPRMAITPSVPPTPMAVREERARDRRDRDCATASTVRTVGIISIVVRHACDHGCGGLWRLHSLLYVWGLGGWEVDRSALRLPLCLVHPSAGGRRDGEPHTCT